MCPAWRWDNRSSRNFLPGPEPTVPNDAYIARPWGAAPELISLTRDRLMKRGVLILGIFLAVAQGHDIITTAITFDREITRIFQARCFSCQDGKSTRLNSS